MRKSNSNFEATKGNEMKTPRDYIKEIIVNDLNLKHIGNTGIINGSLLIYIEKAMKEYAKQWVHESVEAVMAVSDSGNPPSNAAFEIFNKIDAQ